MAKKKNLPMISIQTLANGYSLEFEGMKQTNGFMYFTKEKLLEGFMLHIGLEMLDQLDTETMQDFIVTAMNWKDNKKCVKEIEKLSMALRLMTQRRNGLAGRLIEERKKYTALRDAIQDFKKAHLKGHPDKRLKDEIDKIMKYHKERSNITLESLGITSKDVIEDTPANDEENADNA